MSTDGHWWLPLFHYLSLPLNLIYFQSYATNKIFGWSRVNLNVPFPFKYGHKNFVWGTYCIFCMIVDNELHIFLPFYTAPFVLRSGTSLSCHQHIYRELKYNTCHYGVPLVPSCLFLKSQHAKIRKYEDKKTKLRRRKRENKKMKMLKYKNTKVRRRKHEISKAIDFQALRWSYFRVLAFEVNVFSSSHFRVYACWDYRIKMRWS